MSDNQMPARDTEDALRAAWAILRAHMQEDFDGYAAIIKTVDTRDLLHAMAGVAMAFGMEACGSLEELDARLAEYQEDREA